MTRIRARLTGSNLYLVGLVISMRNDEGMKQIYPRVFPVSLNLACFVIVIVIVIVIIIIIIFGGRGGRCYSLTLAVVH